MPDFLSMGSKMSCAIYYVPQIAFNFFKNSVPRLKNEPLKVLKLIVGRIFWIEISFFNIFWQKIILDKTLLKFHCHILKMSCAIYVPWIPFQCQIFSMGSKMNCAIYYVPWIAFNFFKNSVPRLKNEPLRVLKLTVGRIFWIEIAFFNIFWQTFILEKTLLKFHCHTLKMSCAIYVPWIPFQCQILSSSSSPCLTCSIYVVWNCLETGPILGEYFCLRKGDVASMWHILVRLVDGCQVDMRELCHQCGHLQPYFGEWVGVAPSMSLKMTYFLPSSTLWQFATLLGPWKWAPPSPPKKNFFLSFPKETWHLVGSVFRGRTQVENWHCAGFPPFLNIKLPF